MDMEDLPRSLNHKVQVDLWVALLAIRYGLSRKNHMEEEAFALLSTFWDSFPTQIQNNIRRDIDKRLSTPGPEMDDESDALLRQVLDWQVWIQQG